MGDGKKGNIMIAKESFARRISDFPGCSTQARLAANDNEVSGPRVDPMPSTRARRASAKDGSDGGPNERHDVVLADPPWGYHGQQAKWGAAAKFYPTMTDEELLAFDMRGRFMSDRSILFMWATGPRLDFAIRCLDAWGLTYRGMAFVWVKTRGDGMPLGAQGVRPSIVKPTSELVLAASPVAKGRPLKLHDESIRQIIMAPRTEHSRKPDHGHEAFERMYPTASKIELFARRARPGWQVWGNQAPQAANENAPALIGEAAQ
jgi:N6-adenosine-specific RNA methylase IME4